MNLKLKALMSELSTAERAALADRVGCSLGHLLNVMYGYKPCTPLLASRLEAVTRELFGEHRTVKRWDLIPDLWSEIWPELSAAPGAPGPLLEAAHG